MRNSRGMVRGYVTPAGQTQIDERALNRSTLWRFVTFLGLQTAALQYGLELWQEHEPSSSLHRFEGAVAAIVANRIGNATARRSWRGPSS